MKLCSNHSKTFTMRPSVYRRPQCELHPVYWSVRLFVRPAAASESRKNSRKPKLIWRLHIHWLCMKYQFQITETSLAGADTGGGWSMRGMHAPAGVCNCSKPSDFSAYLARSYTKLQAKSTLKYVFSFWSLIWGSALYTDGSSAPRPRHRSGSAPAVLQNKEIC